MGADTTGKPGVGSWLALRLTAAAIASIVIGGACSSAPSASPTSGSPSSPAPASTWTLASRSSASAGSPRPTASSPLPSFDPILVGAGDIASCTSNGDERTARLLESIVGSEPLAREVTVFTAGDNAYTDGAPSEFRDCYASSWGRFRERTRPALGNHDWNTPGATGFFGYFDDLGVAPGRGWYGYDLGAWHIVVLDANCWAVGGCGARSEQGKWLARDLAQDVAVCTLAIWHQPRWSSGLHGSIADSAPFWETLYAAGADVVVSGHDHDYERFAPQDPAGRADRARGIREFVVGTGGASQYEVGDPIRNSEAVGEGVYGVLELTLHPTGYEWRFVPVAGEAFTDTGSDDCH